MYIVAAAGNTLPDVANVSTALGYTGFQNLNMPITVTARQPVCMIFGNNDYLEQVLDSKICKTNA